jgi:hypothetical protein
MTTPASTASRPLITKHPASPLPFLTGADPKTRIIIFSVVVAAVLAFDGRLQFQYPAVD